MNQTPLDSRLHAFDPLNRRAEQTLQGLLDTDGWQYVTPQPAWAGAARLSLRQRPDHLAGQVTEALPGEALEVLWEQGEWIFVRTVHDRYLGWAQAGGVVRESPQAGLLVTALRAHAYAGPKVSQPILADLCLGAQLTRRAGDVVEEERRRWQPVRLPDTTPAWVQEVVLAPLPDDDVATLALRFLETPYVWGGRSAWGLDCSGLTQVVYGAVGRGIPRDADQQQQALQPVSEPQRGDLAFFPGHVGLMLDGQHMVHANATHMRVTVETLGQGDYGQRLQSSLTGFGRWAR